MLNSIVLSAGKGSRMKSDKPKVLQHVLGYEMINMVLSQLTKAGVQDNTLIVGYKSDEVLQAIESNFNFSYSLQTEQLGTGHAIICAKENFKDKKGNVLITCGDTPLISGDTYKTLIESHLKSKNDLTILTTKFDNPSGYGRIIRNSLGNVEKIVEEKDANKDEKLVKEVNTGVYIFDIEKLFTKIELLSNDNAQNEYYLTDMIEIFKKNNYKIGACVTDDSDEVMGVNDLIALERVNKILQNRINNYMMMCGVQIIDSTTTYIGPNVKIGEGTIIYPGNTIFGKSVIGKSNLILPNNVIIDSKIGDNNQIGPMAYFRNNSEIDSYCRIGNFVEVKNSKIGSNTNAAHLTYIGDATVGKNVNFGCGVITANYDGLNKYKTEIGDEVFIGSNSNLIAPLKINENSFIAAGSTIKNDIEAGSFVKPNIKVEIRENKRK